MKKNQVNLGIILLSIISGCSWNNQPSIEIYETSSMGKKMEKIEKLKSVENPIEITLNPENKYQTLIGFGGAFTESSAYLLNQLSTDNRKLVLEAYFGSQGANYSLTRTHINSCDFSLGNYSYAPIEGDTNLQNFSIDEDRDDLIPMIKEAMAISENGFKILASPWTAPPWMKDNNSWVGGKLLPEYYDTWALYFSKYITEYKKEGIDIWGLTVENEPLGNGNNWESMVYNPDEMVNFTNNHLGPKLKSDGHSVKILGYDQNRGDELKEWADVMFKNDSSSEYFDGTAVHWYASTNNWMQESLEYAHEKAPEKYLIQTEGCIDAEIPQWQNDEWYWKKEATDWGWDWASEKDKPLHPKYVPVYRYARDIIGCMNSWVEGWIDWNMVLDKQGGPNWAKNWCIAPVIVDPEKDEVYFTPLYYTMVHFSKFIRPEAVRIGFENPDNDLMVTAAQNPDGTFVVVLLNMSSETKGINLILGNKTSAFQIGAQAIQTVLLKNK